MPPSDLVEHLDMSKTELVIGLVGATGASTRRVAQMLQDQFEGIIDANKIRYSAIKIKVIEELYIFEKHAHLASDDGGNRVRSHQDAGNQFCEDVKSKDALAVHTMRVIQAARAEGMQAHQRRLEEIKKKGEPLGDEDKTPPGFIYILDSLKRPEEVRALRATYGDGFLLVGCYAPRDYRLGQIKERLLRDNKGSFDAVGREAKKLMERDEEQRGEPYGQNVRKSFQLADVYLNTPDTDVLAKEIHRLYRILFSYPIITPTQDEFGMFHARAASLRSADLSRQVGAIITDDEGDILATGVNEVPKAGGGVYGWSSCGDDRDFVRGHDASQDQKRKAFRELLSIMAESGWTNTKLKGKTSTEQADALERALDKEQARFTQIIEFMRPVHAEMGALMDAARRGVSLRGGTMYVTTFPCHECARLLVAAGLRRVVYIEPYPKSLAEEMYRDSIVVEPVGVADPSCTCGGCPPRLAFEPFVGVSPRRYLSSFTYPENKRKDERGYAYTEETWKRELRYGTPAHSQGVEAQMVGLLSQKVQKLPQYVYVGDAS